MKGGEIRFVSASFFIALVCLIFFSCEKKVPENPVDARLDQAFLAEMYAHEPEIPVVEEKFWKENDFFKELFSGRSSLYMAPLSAYHYCLYESLQGNPYAMACMAEVTRFSNKTNQKMMLPELEGVPEEAYTSVYWQDWGDRYMGPGWTVNRLGDIGGGYGAVEFYAMAADKKNSAEGHYLAYKRAGSATSDLTASVAGGWPEAMGRLAWLLFRPSSFEELKAFDRETLLRYGLRSAYACTTEGISFQVNLYENGLDEIQATPLRVVAWRYIYRLLNRHETGHEINAFLLNVMVESYLKDPEEQQIALRHGELIFQRYLEAYEKRLEQERPRWKALTKELRKELSPMVKALK